ncbi:transcription termination/antitermination NusG family protein [Endozoicomonas sp. 8E]|uniref:transcription termination/antitermination NusG family protein n=1 Tax=Endozoicomonas sp. 8E TaxID=3035692 RepID=UPI00293916A1|nr:transcription termination/antitermination NusG family protein [Endozoicomonas sp. 8E]WOG28385.1 transcription termination/antitermination NusG family protein [Endozoicomonas sp. 8E]
MQNQECLQEGWYLLKTRPRQEQRAQENLETQGFDAYCPIVKVRIRGLLKEEILFPGYVFLYLDLKDLDRFHKIRSTRGVSEIVSFNRITRQLHKDGRLSKSQEQDTQALLPKPIPNGHEVIKDIRLIVETLNNHAETEGTGSDRAVSFNKGDKVIMNHPLYQKLEMTFINNVGSARGMILVQYIKMQRNTQGETVCEVVSEKEMEVRLEDLEKA